MSRSPAERITDILDAIDRCQGYRTHLDDPDRGIAEMASDAILRNVSIIGEAVNHLPAEVTQARPDIDWTAIVGMRHVLVHQYFGIDPSIVVDVVDADLIPLAQALRNMDTA